MREGGEGKKRGLGGEDMKKRDSYNQLVETEKTKLDIVTGVQSKPELKILVLTQTL